MGDIANAPGRIREGQREFTEKDWRDAWDLERGEWKEDSWYPGRNISKFADTHLGGGDYHMQTTDESLPSDHNPFLTDASSYLGTHVEGRAGEIFSEVMRNGETTKFDKQFDWETKGYPGAEGLGLLRNLYPGEEGGAYGFGQDINERTYLDPYTGDMKYEGTRDTGILDEYGNPVTGREGQVRTDDLETSRWYPGKALGAIGDMITGKRKWSNPFGVNELFENQTGEYAQSSEDERKSHMQYKEEHPFYNPYEETETGYSGGLLDYEGLRSDMTSKIKELKENQLNVPKVEDYVSEAGY